jgi:hypothetical protein
METPKHEQIEPSEHHGPDDRADEKRALEHLNRDVGMNYDGGFGSLLDDSAAADIARTRDEHRHGKG